MLLLNLPSGHGKSNLYLDLAREFHNNQNEVYIIAPKLKDQKDGLHLENGINVLRVKTLKQTNVSNIFLKGLAQVLLPHQFKRGYKKHLKGIKFDLVLMPTPPITLVHLAKYIKELNNCLYYLILRDIYPQGAADLGLVKFKIMYDYLKLLERKTYNSADLIGCMSQGNIDYIAQHNHINNKKLVLLPNWQSNNDLIESRNDIRAKYNLKDKYIVLFGGTIGYAQKVENIIFLAKHYSHNQNIVFVVIGNGVKKEYLINAVQVESLTNVIFIDTLPREEYLSFTKSADIGLITIDERFTVPTIPSKLTSYLALKLPVLAIIDKHTDFGSIIDESKSGLWSIGGDEPSIIANFNKLYEDKNLRIEMGNNGYDYFTSNLTSEIAYQNIMKQIAEHD